MSLREAKRRSNLIQIIRQRRRGISLAVDSYAVDIIHKRNALNSRKAMLCNSLAFMPPDYGALRTVPIRAPPARFAFRLAINRQVTAIIERRRTDTCYAVGYGYVFHLDVCKSVFRNHRNGFSVVCRRNDNFFQIDRVSFRHSVRAIGKRKIF